MQGKGVGLALIEAIVEMAREENLERVVAVTTNDNTQAIRFYRRRGFQIRKIRRNAVEEARKIKPEIPRTGNHGAPIKHEIEMEMQLSCRN